MRIQGIVLLLLGVFMASSSLHAQTMSTRYQEVAGGYALLYHGELEAGYPYGYYANTPYANEYTKGKVIFKGVLYTEVPFRLDCRTRRVVMQSPGGKFNVTLDPAEISRLTIGKWDYVWLTKKEGSPEDTYYLVLFEGTGWALYKQYYVSNISKVYVDGLSKQKFSLKERVWLRKGNKWMVMDGRDDFISRFKGYKEQLKKFCKDEKLRPNERRMEDWVKLATYCETLAK